jgi:hypothetical protein
LSKNELGPHPKHRKKAATKPNQKPNIDSALKTKPDKEPSTKTNAKASTDSKSKPKPDKESSSKTDKTATIPSVIITTSIVEDPATKSKLPSKSNTKTSKGTQAKWLTQKQKKANTQERREHKLKKLVKN